MYRLTDFLQPIPGDLDPSRTQRRPAFTPARRTELAVLVDATYCRERHHRRCTCGGAR